RDKDSSTGFAESEGLTQNGDRDETLDFGFVRPSVSVGDYVWLDVNEDGKQDDTDRPIAGVTLTLTGPDG
ncbi:SdrD B-like domain-containing protein, partial [Tessaracoccus sp. OH4464_COT-324]|uniref:SdrD B-like domain-containing protein n=1 Tax=Tessaracoccus sp. OH4464_COT-324 TaxID=2491059 RepID=UPI000FAAF3E3